MVYLETGLVRPLACYQCHLDLSISTYFPFVFLVISGERKRCVSEKVGG